MSENNRQPLDGKKRPYVRRASNRLPIEVSLVVNQPRMNRVVAAEMFDLSPLGCRFLSEEEFAPGAQVLIRIKGLEDWPGTVAWSGPEGIGVDFHAPLSQSVVEHYARTFPREANGAAQAG
jgi:hypothetical protein